MSEVQTIIMKVGMHCDGCARKVRKILTSMAGVEELTVDYSEQKVTVKGALDPNKVARKVSRAGKAVQILEIIASEPLPKPTEDAPAETPQVQTITLRVMMHCEGCARKVKYVLRKIPGVQEVEVDFKEQKAIIKGNMDMNIVLQKASKTGKKVEIWPAPFEESKEEIKKVSLEEKKNDSQEKTKVGSKSEDVDVPKEDKKAIDDKKDAPKANIVSEEKALDDSKNETREALKEENKDVQGVKTKQQENKDAMEEQSEEKDVSTNKKKNEESKEESKDIVEEVMPSTYIVYRLDAPQIFSDDNPNACIII